MQLQWPIALRAHTPPSHQQLKPAGHSAAAEALVQPIIFLGSTILAVIACYVLAEPQIQAVFAGTATTQDWLVIGLVGGLGIMVDTAMILSASRLRMHLSRGKRDWPWAVITGVMLFLCLSVESMTLLYFGYLVAPASVPSAVVQIIVGIHNVLFFIRNGMPPLIIAFFTTCLLPLTIEPADRDRATKATTSVNIAVLQEDLVKLGPLASREEKVQALADQIALFEHASRATPEEQKRNGQLIEQLRRQSGLAGSNLDGPMDASERITRSQTEEMLGDALAEVEDRLRIGMQRLRLEVLQQSVRGEQTSHEAPTPLHALATTTSAPASGPVFHQSIAPASTSRPISARPKPLPGTREYAELVDQTWRDMVANEKPVTLDSLVTEMGDSQETVLDAIRLLQQTEAERRPAGRRRRTVSNGLYALLAS